MFDYRLKASDVAYIGLREVDPEEAKIIQDLDMQSFSMQDVDELGIREVTFFYTMFGRNLYSNQSGIICYHDKPDCLAI